MIDVLPNPATTLLDVLAGGGTIGSMDTFPENTVAPDVEADAKALIEHLTTGKPLDPEVRRRIRMRGERIGQKIFDKHGVLDIGVPAIRELRGELPIP